MNNLITMFASIDPIELEGLLSRFGLHPTALAIALYVVAIINFLIPVLGPFVYRIFGKKIETLKVQVNAFKSEFLTKVNHLDETVGKLENGIAKIGETLDTVSLLGTKVDSLTDLLFIVLENSRLPEETKEKVKEVRAIHIVADREFKRVNSESIEALSALRKEVDAIREANVKLTEQLNKKPKKK